MAFHVEHKRCFEWTQANYRVLSAFFSSSTGYCRRMAETDFDIYWSACA